MSTDYDDADELEPGVSEPYIIQELNDTIEYLAENQDEIRGLETDSGDYWVSVPELVEQSDLEGIVDSGQDDLMEDIDDYATWVARLGGFNHTDDISRYKNEFEDGSFGRKYWRHRKEKTGDSIDLDIGELTEMPHFKIPGTEEVL